jgi:hypothetical protein
MKLNQIHFLFSYTLQFLHLYETLFEIRRVSFYFGHLTLSIFNEWKLLTIFSDKNYIDVRDPDLVKNGKSDIHEYHLTFIKTFFKKIHHLRQQRLI